MIPRTGSLTILALCQSFLTPAIAGSLPEQAQVIDQRIFNVLNGTRPPTEFNATSLFVPPGSTKDSLLEQPFHVYDDEFLKIIGETPTLTRIGHSPKDPLFHEAVVWHKETDEVFFVQNAGARDAGTGLNKSAIIEKISLAQAAAVSHKIDAVGLVNITTVPSSPMVLNPNGATNYRGQLIFTSEGQGDDKPPGLSVVNPNSPYNSTVILNNYFGRQFNSLNDVAIHPKNKEIYFTDTIYGYVQDFRPAPGLQDQVYRFNPDTGAVTVVADEFDHPNGLTFSPDGDYAYITDTGISSGFFGFNFTRPASIYRYDVKEDGTFENRKLFAFVNARSPDGIHCDSWGNVYAGCGDGVHVWNPSGKLIGKIYVGATSANFNFAGQGRMVICAETDLYYATLAAAGSYVDSEMS
ncbi:unnamed protein product [Penicillium olsonii]|uniref:SMP-30/Gluconolactonase/LRE-like region domain-containing protein n=1 Tax=Penicillium olsonii TaxID=99116 RepID=A0A9W4HQZ0_PENOL|nr:unnamed protein product [Penicillium olsonii]CAG8256120.1 unnamed protein product [Penicillium olsonii]